MTEPPDLTPCRLSRNCGRLAMVVLVSALILSPLLTVVQGQTAPTATLRVSKSITGVSLDNIATFKLTVENNGTVPVFDVQVYEYINTALQPLGAISVTSPSGNGLFPFSAGGVATASQIIVDPPPPATLKPGESLSLEYRMYAPRAGDFQVPADVVWFTFLRGSSTLRSSYYSGGLLLHIANGYEKLVIRVYPYVISGATFAVTLFILFWARRRLQRLRKKQSELDR